MADCMENNSKLYNGEHHALRSTLMEQRVQDSLYYASRQIRKEIDYESKDPVADMAKKYEAVAASAYDDVMKHRCDEPDVQVLAALFILTRRPSFLEDLLKKFFSGDEFIKSHGNVILVLCWLLKNEHYSLSRVHLYFSASRENMIAKFVLEKLEEDLEKDWLLLVYSCAEIFGKTKSWGRLIKKTSASFYPIELVKSEVKIFECLADLQFLERPEIDGTLQCWKGFTSVKPSMKLNSESPAADGVKHDRPRDPPGQRSVYIPPGDTSMESYRLSTFFRFPSDSPVNIRRLAKHGFFYTGYKDRVKCFSCAVCAENWRTKDDVTSPIWHSSDCKMIGNEECGNIPLASFFPNSASRRQVRANEALDNALDEAGLSSNAASSSQDALNAQQHFNGLSQAEILFKHRYNGVELQEVLNLELKQKIINDLNLHREADRLKTFDYWPSYNKTVVTADLGRRGFFYLGYTDCVQCIFCGAVFHRFDNDIGIDYEHCSRCPDCRLVKGLATENVPSSNEQPRSMNELHDPSDIELLVSSGLRIEVQRAEQDLQEAMNSSLVMHAKQIGFEEDEIREIVRQKIAAGTMYSTLSELLDDLQTKFSNNTSSENSSFNASSSMEKRIQELQDERKCKICWVNLAEMVIVPCGHLCVCEACPPKLKSCPICRAAIEKFIRTYLS